MTARRPWHARHGADSGHRESRVRLRFRLRDPDATFRRWYSRAMRASHP